MKHIETNKLFSLLLIFFIINLILGAFNLLQLGRPFIYYEYLLIPLAFAFSSNYYFRFSAILSLFLSDILISVSKIYYFDTFNFLQKFSSIFISNFSIKFWVIVLLSFSVVFLLIHLLISKSTLRSISTSKNDKKFGFLFLLLSFSMVYGIDSLFGSSSLQFKPNGKLNVNFSQSIVMQYAKDARIYLKKYLPVSQIENFESTNKEESLSYRNLLKDSSKRENLNYS
jgi:hypothetical protein